jgi:hypothetical protein
MGGGSGNRWRVALWDPSVGSGPNSAGSVWPAGNNGHASLRDAWKQTNKHFVCGSCHSFFVLPYEIVVGAEICGRIHNPLRVHRQQNPMTIKCSACLGDWESVECFELACQYPNWHHLLKRCVILDGSSGQYFFLILHCSPGSALSPNDIADILERLSFVCGSCRSFFVLPYEIVFLLEYWRTGFRVSWLTCLLKPKDAQWMV